MGPTHACYFDSLLTHPFSFLISLFSFPTMNKNNNPYDRHLVQNQNPSSYFIVPNPPISEGPASNQDRDQDHRDRFPQWTQEETRQFLSVRAELDRSFTETKRNKPLWEAVAAQMQQLGFVRTPEQCKSKWKNLVTRYKGSEAMEGDRSFPFHDEMRTIFADRMERLLKGKEKAAEEEEEEENKKHKKKKRRTGGEAAEAMREFGRRQMETEKRWMEAAEAREAERRWKEEEWRRGMAALEEERAEMERQWREKEEERRAREEARDERRHEIITAILTKIAEKASFQD